jgi:hypothetical protein
VDQDVRIPDRRHAMIGDRLDPDRHIAGGEVDGRDTF